MSLQVNAITAARVQEKKKQNNEEKFVKQRTANLKQ
jgi:hypothetical protein